MGEGGGHGRVGQVIGGHIDRLNGCDAAFAGGGDALLQLAHLALQGGLVAHSGGQAPQQGGNLGTSLDVAEDVINEDQHRAAFVVAEIFRHGEGGQRYAHARPRRLVHLAENQDGVVDHAAGLHVQPQVVTFAAAFTHAGKQHDAGMLADSVAH